jgi:hypothetical protein
VRPRAVDEDHRTVRCPGERAETHEAGYPRDFFR